MEVLLDILYLFYVTVVFGQTRCVACWEEPWKVPGPVVLEVGKLASVEVLHDRLGQIMLRHQAQVVVPNQKELRPDERREKSSMMRREGDANKPHTPTLNVLATSSSCGGYFSESETGFSTGDVFLEALTQDETRVELVRLIEAAASMPCATLNGYTQ